MTFKMKKLLGLTAMGILTLSAVAYASTGNASSVSITYYDTYATGNTVSMNGTVTVTGYVNPNYSDNKCWYELNDGSNSTVQESMEAPGFNGTAFTYNVNLGNFHLDLNPDGANYDGCVANGKAQN